MLDRLGQAALAALLLFVVLSGPAVSPAGAQEADAAKVLTDPYSVTGVTVDVTAASAAEARDKAIAQAQRKAFEVLFKRVVSDGANRVAPNVSEFDLQRMIQGFEIEQERGSAVRYVASMGFKFRQKAVSSYISSLGLQVNASAPPAGGAAPFPVAAAPPVPMPPAKPTLVLPVAQGDAAALLWEERTPWRSAWEDYVAASGAGKLLVPAGELTDIADIGAKEATAGDATSLVKIAGHYDAGMVAVVVLAGADRLGSAAGAQVMISRYGMSGVPMGPVETVAIPGTLGEEAPAFLARVVTAVAGRLAVLPVMPAAAATDAPVVARVPITGMSDWLEVRRRLSSDPMVSSVETVALTRSKVDVAIHYRGQVDGLRAMLDRDGLTLVPTPGGWTLYIKSAVTSPAPLRFTPALPLGVDPEADGDRPAAEPKL